VSKFREVRIRKDERKKESKKERKKTIGFCHIGLFFHMHGRTRLPLEGFFIKFDI
jgi:hypothetical protein